MNTADRKRKLLALTRYLQGDANAVRELKPDLVIDLNQLTGDEVEFIQQLQASLTDVELSTWTLERLETHFGRKLSLIPMPSRWTF